MIEVIACFALAAFCWTVIGVSVISLIVPQRLALAFGPSTGWAVHSIVTSIVFRWIEIGRLPVSLLLALSTCAALVLLRSQGPWFRPVRRFHWGASVFVLLGSVGLGAAVVPAIYPHSQGDMVALAGPIFDHSKVALVNEIAQSGLPAVNPVFGEIGQPATLSYYYLWHFSAASMALAANVSGWTADIAVSWFTAFASLTLMMGLAAWLGRSAMAAAWALVLALTASIRPFLAYIFGYIWAHDVTGWPSGFGAWMFQTTWAPQHVQSAACTIIALLILGNVRGSRGVLTSLVLALVVAAGFESSSWVGGVTFALTAVVLGPWLLVTTVPAVRLRLMAVAGVAAVLSFAMMFPFITDQVTSLSARGAGWPFEFSPAEILGESVAPESYQLFNVPAFFLLFLPVELCAIYLIGIPALAKFRRKEASSGARANGLRVLVCTVLVSLLVSAFLRSTLAPNNDLGWRGALPAIMVLVSVAAAGLASWRTLPPLSKALAVALIIPGVVQGWVQIQSNVAVPYNAAGREFLLSSEMWKAVRQNADRTERIASNPSFLAEMTPWPVNISWALLSKRRSCYAGGDLAVPFIAKPKPALVEIDRLFARVFAGHPEQGDLRDMVFKFDCRVVVVNPGDGAWSIDPFARSPLFRLVDQRENGWRIYRSDVSGPMSIPAQ